MTVNFSFRPKLVDALKGYSRADFFQDLAAGVTVGVVALPLAMAFAIASGVKPEAGPGPRTCARGVSTSVYFRDPDDNLVEFTVY